MFKIMFKGAQGVEQIDEAESKAEAQQLVREYCLAFNSANVWVKPAKKARGG